MRIDASTEKPAAVVPLQAPAHLRLDFGEGGGIEPGGGMEDDPARRGRVEHAVDDHAMEVQMRIEGGAEAVDEGDRAGGPNQG